MGSRIWFKKASAFDFESSNIQLRLESFFFSFLS